MGVRLFADAGAALSRDEIQTRVMDVLKLFDKVNAEKVRATFTIYTCLWRWGHESLFVIVLLTM